MDCNFPVDKIQNCRAVIDNLKPDCFLMQTFLLDTNKNTHAQAFGPENLIIFDLFENNTYLQICRPSRTCYKGQLLQYQKLVGVNS